MRIPGFGELGLKEFAGKLYHRVVDNAVSDRAGLLAYYFLFALFPFLFFLVTLTAYLPLQHSRDQLITYLAQIMPHEGIAIIRGQLDALLLRPRPHLLTFGLAIAIWSASRGVDALRGSLNLAYDVKESRPFWRTQGMAIGVTLVTSLLVLLSFAALALGGAAGLWLTDHIGMGKEFLLVWGWLRWPITATLIMLVAALLYYYLPDVEQEWKFITPGSVIGTALWLLAAWGFTFYAAHFGNYDKTYGSIGGVIVLMTWLFISGFVFVLGGEINALIEHSSPEGKARGARVEGEPAPPPEDRPSFAAPGASKRRESARRSHFRFLRRKHGPDAGKVLEKEKRAGDPLAEEKPGDAPVPPLDHH